MIIRIVARAADFAIYLYCGHHKKKPVAITLSLIIILVACLGISLNPVYLSGGHGSEYQFSLLDFLDILSQLRVPPAVSLSYFICLTLLLAGLLVYQHTPQSFPTLPLSREQRRRFLRRSMLGGLILFIALICWAHRALFFLKPLADSLLEKIADGYQQGHYGLPENQQMASSRQKQAEDINALEERAARSDPEVLATIGRQLLGSQTTRAQGVTLLKKVAARGDARIQYELGAIFLFGRHGIAQNLEMGRKWWDMALAQKHVKTMEYVAPAYQK